MKTAVVSGGTQGLGRAISLELGRRGYRFIALHRSDENKARALLEAAADESIIGRVLKIDLTTADLTQLAGDEQITTATELVLVNNASAAFTPKPLHLIEPAELDALVDTAIKGSFRLTHALLRPLMRVRGTVVNVLSSVVNEGPPPGFSAYATAKFGQLGLTRGLAADYAKRGLKVFSVSPGFMLTGLTEAWHADLIAKMNPEEPDEVARRVAELVDGEALGTGEDYGTRR